MSNELLFVLEIVLVFGSLLLVKKFFGKYGLIAWVPIVAILANIQVCKQIDLWGLSATLGNVLFASSFLATDILSECYGKDTSKKAVYAGIGFMVFFLIISQITLWFMPNDFDTAQASLEGLFTLSMRTTACSLVMYALANVADVWLFHKLKDIMHGKKMWFRNNVATITCNCLENFGFIFLAFYGIMDISDLLSISLTSCAIETVIAILDTPFLYIAKKIKD
jgi:uncharacterized integral membrane protein (TIGR00697 family)